MASEYIFIDEWDVDAPIEAVFEALADARTYPKWWTPVYREATSDGPAGVGRVTTERFKGQLPYVLTMTSEIVRMEPPREFEIKADGDLRGRGVWALTPNDGGLVHVKFRLAGERRPGTAAGAAAAVPGQPQLRDQARKAGLGPYARAQEAAPSATQ